MPYKNPIDQRRAARAHYEANRASYIDRARDRNRRQKDLIKAYLRRVKDAPCTDCGIRYPFYVMQFDHLGGKLFDVAAFGSKGAVSLATVRREVAKCEVVCANCHAERTYQRGQRFTSTAATAGAIPLSGTQVALF